MTSMLNQADQKVDSLVVRPIVEACGTVHLPGSKSISNRALLLAALADGTTRLEGLLKADDTERMIESLVKLGIKIERVDDETALVAGIKWASWATMSPLFKRGVVETPAKSEMVK